MHGGVKIRNGFKLYEGKKITFTQNYNAPIKTEIVDRISLSGGSRRKAGPAYVYSEPISNGELVCVQKITKLRASDGGGFLLTVSDVSHPRNHAECKRIWIHKDKGVDPQHVTDGFASTSYKIQGNEYEYVVFWMKDNPPQGGFYTREHAYVAVSRGKSRVWCFGNKRDFLALCSQKATPRTTTLHWLLSNEPWVNNIKPSSPTLDPFLKRRSPLRLMARDEPCVPRASETIASKRRDNEDDDDGEDGPQNKRKKKRRKKRAAPARGNVGAMPLGRAVHPKGPSGVSRKPRASRK